MLAVEAEPVDTMDFVESKKVRRPCPTLLFCLNILLQLSLFVVFLLFFGIPAVRKYLARETIVISSVEETQGIEAPSITIVARQLNAKTPTSPALGWKTVDENMISILSFNLANHCKEIDLNVEACVSNDTFALTDFLMGATLGYSNEASPSLFHESMTPPLWKEDVTATFQGRHFTLSLPRTITRKETDALVFSLDTTSSFTYIFWVHDEDFFLTNINPFSTPSKIWWVKGADLVSSGYYRDLTLTKHKRLNLKQRPCEEDPSYSFTICIKEKLSEKFGCRLPWDKWSLQERSICATGAQFSNFEELYEKLANSDAEQIAEVTGCREPCSFKEYKFVASNPTGMSKPGCAAFWAASRKTQVEEEVLLYPFTSLVAEFGGSLGLFLGFSFFSIWQQLRGYFCK